MFQRGVAHVLLFHPRGKVGLPSTAHGVQERKAATMQFSPNEKQSIWSHTAEGCVGITAAEVLMFHVTRRASP